MISALVIEDDPDLRLIAAVALRMDRAFRVESAASAATALARMRADCARYDVVLAGTTTAEMDGALVEAIRWLPDCADVPIVFLTPSGSGCDAGHYRAMGASGVLTTPFDPVELPRQVTDLLPATAH